MPVIAAGVLAAGAMPAMPAFADAYKSVAAANHGNFDLDKPDFSKSLSPAQAALRSPREGQRSVGALSQNTFTGNYDDPAHPGCKRSISYIGGRNYQIDGADEDKKPWKVIATKKNSATLVVDFTSKGGPSDVSAVQQIKSGNLKFPDGNEWKKTA